MLSAGNDSCFRLFDIMLLLQNLHHVNFLCTAINSIIFVAAGLASGAMTLTFNRMRPSLYACPEKIMHIWTKENNFSK